MNGRLIFIVTLALGILAAPLAVEAQQAGKVYRVGFLWDSPAVFPDAIEAFRRGLRDLGWAFAAMMREAAGGLVVLPDPMFVSQPRRIVELVARSRLPTIYAFREFVGAGGLMSYGVNLPDSYRCAARYVDKILKGAKAADLPVEQPTKFELVINLKTAKTLGLTIPQSILIRADEVIQ